MVNFVREEKCTPDKILATPNGKNTLQNKFLVTAQAATIDNLLKKSRLM